MKLPIDVSELTFLVAVPPVPVMDFETKKQKADDDGQPMHTVQLVCLGDGNAEILAVKFAGPPGALMQGAPAKVTNLVATPWSMGERSGVSFKASSVEPAVVAGRNGSAAEKGS
jgi:hypothetical protein